ncbi:MAG TPA: efflux RND transporter periplasmic adaptor subunit [Longimicrobiales bacterium]|nr:efflux RND transporter periplasmic adaptor subunit [Longimicrobiales bacterium]
MRRKTKLIIGGGAVLAVIAIATLSALRGNDGVAVRIEPVQRRDLVATVTASGWIEPNRKVDVQADIMGRIIELRIVEGQQVSRGDILLRIDPSQYEASVARARAAVNEAGAREAQARANLIQAERQAQRMRTLAQQENMVSPQQVEEAETQELVQRQLLEAAKFGVAQARSALVEAQDLLSKTVIRAPMDGVVTRLNVEEGETAIVGTMNNVGSLLLTVADLGAMEAVVRVDETDVPELHVGDSAVVQIDAFPRQMFTGRVTEIGHSSVTRPVAGGVASASGAQAVDFEVRIRLDNPPPTLRSDLSATADIVTARREGVLSVPIIALTVRERTGTQPLPQEDPTAQAAAERAAGADEQGDQEGVYVVRSGKAEFVPVQVGIAGAQHFEVLSGVTESDSVVAGPYEAIRTLEDGQAVRPMGTPPGGRGAAAAQPAGN